MTPEQIAEVHEAIMKRLARERANAKTLEDYFEDEADAILEVLAEVLK